MRCRRECPPGALLLLALACGACAGAGAKASGAHAGSQPAAGADAAAPGAASGPQARAAAPDAAAVSGGVSGAAGAMADAGTKEPADAPASLDGSTRAGDAATAAPDGSAGAGDAAAAPLDQTLPGCEALYGACPSVATDIACPDTLATSLTAVPRCRCQDDSRCGCFSSECTTTSGIGTPQVTNTERYAGWSCYQAERPLAQCPSGTTCSQDGQRCIGTPPFSSVPNSLTQCMGYRLLQCTDGHWQAVTE